MKTENCWGSRDGKLSKVPLVRYSAAYPTGRELMLEPRYGCAGEAMLRREAARSAPGGTARGRAGAYARAPVRIDSGEL